MVEQVYRYKAFVSYRHLEQDRRWARWLIERLEGFRTPRALIRAGVPSRIGKLFRDDDEIPASSDLSRQIEDALTSSQYLIVVCSPATPASKWVRQEIEFFRSLGRSDRILALLIEGEPSESFPENLLRVAYVRTASDGVRVTEWHDAEPIAADVRPRSDERQTELERRALLKIAAGLLGCTFDDLFQRERQRRRHRQRLVGSAAAVAVTASFVGLYLWWDYYVPKISYYAEFGTRWGVPFGVGELSRETAAHRGASYEITSEQHHVTRMRRLGGSGTLVALSGDGFDDESFYQGIAVWRVYYQDDQVRTIELADGEEKLIRKLDYDFAADRRTAIELYRSSKGNVGALQAGMFNIVTFAGRAGIESVSHVAGHQLTFTRDGLIALRNFQTAFGQPTDAGNGTFGRSYTYYSNGLIRSFRDLDEDGSVHLDAAGIAEVFRRYDASGNLVFLEWRNAAGRPTLNSHGYARWQARRDSYGNVVEVRFSGPDGAPATNNIFRASWFRSKIDEHGNGLQDEFFDAHGHRALNPAGFSELRWKYDSRGRIITEECFGQDRRPVLNRSGYFRLTRRYDDRGAVVAERYNDTRGKPIIPRGIGWAGLDRRFDKGENLVSQRYLGLDGKPMLVRIGVASVTKTQLPRRNAELESYFGVHGEPVVRSDFGAATIFRQFDQYGNVVDESYFGDNGRKVPRRDTGVAEIKASYNDRGDLIDESFFNQNGHPVADGRLGVARVQRSSSKDGKLRSEHYFDVDDRPTLRRDLKVAGIEASFDRFGNEIEEDYFGDDGKRLARAGLGVAVAKWRYDSKGNMTEESYFDAGGGPVPRSDRGFARIVFRSDIRGNPVEQDYFATDGKRATNLLGFSELKRRYDQLGRKVEESYFGPDNSPAVRNDAGASRIVWRYDSAGIKRDVFVYDAKNQLRSHLRFSPTGSPLP